MPLPFNRALDLKLIAMVKENPIIYNSTHPKHMDFDEREVVWQKIGDALSRPAVEFAGIQCQIHYGDFQEDKHKPGLIENLNEYLPEQYSSSWGIEKKILKEFRRHHGLSQIEAKFLYTKTARDLPTYGVTFFLVKEKQKGKKKLVPRLLGINAESILRLDEVTKEILQVWPLTQVKTYHAGKTETFTLNFGDYSDKEYSVKTNDAHRIRDILQGYIDIIRKRMEANYNLNQTEHYAICEDNVQASRGHIMERIEHKPSKIVEESFVGPSQIFTYEPGRAIAQGTQIVTVQQLVINAKGNNQQTVLVGEVPMRKGMSLEFVRKLNRLNSNSVKIVTLLTEPNQANLSEAVNIFNSMDADMPSLIEGVNEAAEKETDEEAKKKLLNDLQELVDHMRALSDNINTNVNPEEAQDISKRIADLSIQMCCALDPRMKKRGEFCRRSRKSFIKDEKMDASLRRASCLVAAQHATETIQQVKQHLDEEYQGPKLDPADVEELEKSAANKMAKLNAAVALNLMAYADTQNIDYAVAVTSMNTINELLPKLAKDAKALASVKDGKDREAFLEAIQSLCDAVKLVCIAADPDDYQKMQNAVKDYGRASDKLLFTFRRGGNRNTDKEKEILDLSKEVAEKNKLLLDKSNELAGLVSEPEAAMLEDASGRCAQAARDIITCAELSAACIAEPHCRSALKASAENLSSSVQHLALTWRPMLERDDTKHLAPQLRDRTMDLAKALDKLKGAFAGMDDVPEEPDKRMINQKLKFVKSVAAAKDKMNAAETEFNVPLTEVSKNETEEEIQNRLTQKLAQLNAALAALVTATADRDKPDYETAELAINTIGELMPDIVRDGKLLSADKDVASREKMMNELKALCKATKDICDSTDNGNLNDVHGAASKFAASSGKLFYVFNPRARRDNEHKIADISSSVDEKASQLMAAVQDLSQRVDAEAAVDLEIAGSKAADAAAALHTAVSVTAPYIEDPRCQEALLSAIDSSSHANQNLSLAWMNLLKNPRYKDLGDSLDEKRLQLERELDRLRKACRDIGADASGLDDQTTSKEVSRLQFIKTAEAARAHLDAAYRELDKPVVSGKVPSDLIAGKLTDALHHLNAAIADLVAATADRENPDYVTADNAINAINQLLPPVIKDTKTLSSLDPGQNKAETIADLKALCDATADICDSLSQHSNRELNKAAVNFANVSGKVVYSFDPRANQERENRVLDLSTSACQKVSQLLNEVHQLARRAPPRALLLDRPGAAAAARADALLTIAQVTAPSIQDASCCSKLISSSDALRSASDDLASIWRPLVQQPQHSSMGPTLEKYQNELERNLEDLKKACQLPDNEFQNKSNSKPKTLDEEKKLKFISTVSVFDKNLKRIEDELDKPMVPSSAPVAASLQNKLANSLAQLNAAIAGLLHATRDRDNPDYVKAERSIDEITQLMPELVKGTLAVTASKDPQTRDLMVSDLRELCAATRQLCLDNGESDVMNLKDNASKFTEKSNKLFYVVSPRVDQNKEHEIVDLAKVACQKTTELLANVQRLMSQMSGEVGSLLDTAGGHTADAANVLLTTAQLTAPSIHDPRCKDTLVSSIDALDSSVNVLASTWKPILLDPSHDDKRDQLENHKKDLKEALNRLKAAALEDKVVLKSPMRKAPPPPPKRISSYESAPLHRSPITDITRDFLDNIRSDEAQVAREVFEADQKRKKREEEKLLQQKLTSTVDAAVGQIQKAGEELTETLTRGREAPPALSLSLSPAQTLAAQKQLELRLAAAARAAAALLAAQHMNSLDYSAACEPAASLGGIMPHIVQDAKLLRGALDEDERKSFLEDVLAMFDATKVLLGAAKNDHRKINESAVVFGNKTAKLLYVVSTDVDPSQEKEVFALARNIGDSASRLAVTAAEAGAGAGAGAGEGEGAREQLAALCTHGGRAADAAGTLLYTAKLVGPAIHIPECQQALVKITEDLSDHVRNYNATWGHIQTDAQLKRELDEETNKLEHMLSNFKENIQSGKLVKRVVVDRVTVHNTPLRNLACLILEDAQKRAKQVNIPPEQRGKFAKYATDLGQAIRHLDILYHRSCNAPHDVERRQQLENGVQGLQVMVLMGRPTADVSQNNIVDLTDYVRAVSEEADKLYKECKENQPEVQMIRDHCQKIKNHAEKIMNPELADQLLGDETTMQDRSEVAEFAEECDKRVNTLNSIIESLDDGKYKIELQEKAARLTESTHLLSFATKSDLATTQSVSLDATLEELTDLEKKIDEMLAVSGKRRVPYKGGLWAGLGRGKLMGSICGGSGASSLPPAYTAYLDDVRVAGDFNEPHHKQRSKEHLLKVLNLLKTLVMTDSRHVATWQPINHSETASITEQILKEMESYDREMAAINGHQKSILSEEEINKLLLPTRTQLQVDPKQIPERLLSAAGTVSGAVGTLIQSTGTAAFPRSVPPLIQAVTHLSSLAHTVPVHDIAHSQKIDVATKEMSLQAYKVLKTAELVSQQPNNYASRSRFLDACSRLNDAIAQLVRTTSPSRKLQAECGALLARPPLEGAAAAGWRAALHAADALHHLHTQRDILQKVSEEGFLPREEFRRSLGYVTAAVHNSLQYAAHFAYLISISEQHKDLATKGFIDVARIQSLSETVQESCHRIIRTELDQVKEEAPMIIKQVQDFKQAITEAQEKIAEEQNKNELNEANVELEEAITELTAVVHEKTLNRAKLTAVITKVLDSTRWICYTIEKVSIVPEVKEVSPEIKACRDDILKNCRNLNTKTLALIREVKSSEDIDPMTWVTFGTRKAVLDMFEALVNSVQENGKHVGILEPSQSDIEEESQQANKSSVQIQLDLANKWLSRPTVKPEIKTSGEQAVRTIISLGEKVSEDMTGPEKEEMLELTTSSEELLAECLKKHDPQKASLLMERLKLLRKAIERGIVSRVVEDFLEGEEPLADLEILADAEKDPEQRKFLLERKIAQLQARLARAGRTARVLARAAPAAHHQRLLACTEQTELLAPMLVQAAQKRVISPDDQAAIEHYQKLLSEYADSLANIRSLCDQAVDPMAFVQTAGEAMQRLREDTTNDNDPQKCAYASTAITKLANRVITVGMSSKDVRKDIELQKALKEAKEKLMAVVPGPNSRRSRIPDWKVTTAEILRTTGEVESVLGGEMIFKKQQTSDEPIFAAALDLHTAMRGWSAKDNEIVAVAKRVAVLLAKLSHYMNIDRKRDVIVTAKSIVTESREVAELAGKLAHECTDVRIKTNLLKICERIPTISGQLQMLATVKGSLGHQGLKEDQEDMNMLVANAQNLMLSVQEAVSGAASASVKIMSQRCGPRIRWVRNTYY